jgi:8-oxo-dGTP diphosphatase
MSMGIGMFVTPILKMKSIEVVAAVIVRDSEILCVQRGQAKYSYLSEKWEFPGGKIEKNETEIDAIKREILEELDMRIFEIKKLTIVEHSYPDFQLKMHVFKCSTIEEPTLNEHKAFKWLTKNELEKLDWATADIPVVKMIL